MRFSVVLFLSTALSVAAVPVERRQATQLSSLLSSLSSSFPGLAQIINSYLPAPKKIYKIEKLLPSVSRPGAERVRIWYGPFKLKAANATQSTGNSRSMDPAGTAWNYVVDSDYPRDITVLRANSTVVFEDGTKAEVTHGIYNHHQMFVNANKGTPSFASCEGSKSMGTMPTSLFMGGSEDKGDVYYSTPDGMFSSGYYIGKNDTIMFGGDVVNYNMEEKTVYSVTEFDYIKGKPEGFLDTSAQTLQVGMCNGMTDLMNLYSPKQKKFAIQGKPMNITIDGYIVAQRGHVHDGGVNILIKLNDKTICDSRAVYGTAGQGNWKTIDHMVQCTEPIKVSKGDKLYMDAYYDMETYPPRQQHGGGMGEIMALMNMMVATKM